MNTNPTQPSEPVHEESGAIRGCGCDLCDELRLSAALSAALAYSGNHDAPTGSQGSARVLSGRAVPRQVPTDAKP
jgi:hypothetical protein